MLEKKQKAERTKRGVFYEIEDNIRMLKNLKELSWTVEYDAPEAKKAFEDKYRRIKNSIEKLSKEYSSLKKSLEGDIMSKSRDELVEDFTEKVQKGEMTVEEVEKAMQAGYQTATPEGAKQDVEEVSASSGVKDSGEVPEAEADGAKDQESEAKFANGLFNKPYTLGSTLVQAPNGNVMANMKKPAMDYNKVYDESTKNIKVNRADYKKD